jgi:hypothetical protein
MDQTSSRVIKTDHLNLVQISRHPITRLVQFSRIDCSTFFYIFCSRFFQMNGNVFPGMMTLGEAIRAQNNKSGPLRGSDQVLTYTQ